MLIKEITYNDFSDWVKMAVSENIVFSNHTNYYGLFDDNKLVAITGIVFYKNSVKFKNHYVPMENRGKGYFKILLDFSIKVAIKNNAKKIMATCTDKSINEYLKRGAIIVRKYKNCSTVIINLWNFLVIKMYLRPD